MSTLSAAKLAQYNKKSPYKRQTPIDSEADKSFGTWSYANMYDALYNKFSQNKNFNLDMWHQAIKLGEQDQYLALLEQNKDNTLASQFYDPQYYDYENMMLELYASFADNTIKTPRVEEVYDNIAGEWVENSLGDMTEQEYLRYQLNKNYEYKAAEIKMQMEQDRKDSMSWLEKTGHSVLATLAEFNEGLLTGLTGMVDFFVGLGYATGYSGAALLTGDKENQNWLDAFVDYFGEIGLTAAEKRTVRAALDEYERTHTYFKDINGNITNAGKFIAGVSNSMGMMIPAIVTAAATSGTSLAFLGPTSFYMSIFSVDMYENATNPYLENTPSGLKIMNSALRSGVEAIVEWGLGKVLGGTIQNQMIGLKAGGSMGKAFLGMSKTAGLKMAAKSAAQEGLEEFLQDFSTNLVDQFMDALDEGEGFGNNGVTFQTLCDSFWAGVLSSVFMTGGNVAVRGMQSASINAQAKKYSELEKKGGLDAKTQEKINAFKKKHGEYDGEFGPADIVIEGKDGKLQKVTGLNKMYYGQILSDMRQAMTDLKEGKVKGAKAIELAQEVYSGLSVMTQFYSSFDKTRVENCEKLLNRVVEAENNRQSTGVNETTYEFATKVESSFVEMVGGVNLRAKLRAVEAAKKQKKKLEKGKVNEVKAITEAGTTHTADTTQIEKILSPKAKDVLKELSEAYPLIFTTDGHVAVADDDVLFVSMAWLENYTTMDIYTFLQQSEVLEVLLTDKDLQPMVKAIHEFCKTQSKNDQMTSEEALMNFLFNKTVYQAFLLSRSGENLHKFKKFIFSIYNTVNDLADASGHIYGKDGKVIQKRQAALKKIINKMKETMREPTLTAIFNWRMFDLQDINVDIGIITKEDVNRIDAYKKHLETLDSGLAPGKKSSAYEHLVEDIIANGDFDDDQLRIIRKHLAGEADMYEDIEAVALLDEADARITTPDFVVSPKYSLTQSFYDRTRERIERLHRLKAEGADVDIWLWINVYNEMYDNLGVILDQRVNYTREYLDMWQEFHDDYESFQDVVMDRGGVDTTTDADFIPRVEEGLKLYRRALIELSGRGKQHVQGLGAFTIPYQAAEIAIGGDRAAVQFVTDALDEFAKMYGISAKQMIIGDISAMSIEQRNRFEQDRKLLGADNVAMFVIKKLESMLSDEYIVTPTRKQTMLSDDISDFLRLFSYNFVQILYLDVHNFSNGVADTNVSVASIRHSLDTVFERLTPVYNELFNSPLIVDDVINDFIELHEEYRKKFLHKNDPAVIDWALEHETAILDFYKRLESEREVLQSEIVDFLVAKRIPADEFISHDILDEPIETRNTIFKRMFTSTDERNRNVYRRYINEALKDSSYEHYHKDLLSLVQKSDWEIDNLLEVLVEAYERHGDIINPETGEFLGRVPGEDIFGDLLLKIKSELRMSNTTLPLSDFIDISRFPTIDLSEVKVKRTSLPEGVAGSASSNRIEIDFLQNDNLFDTLIHEVNHVLQIKYGISGGFSEKEAYASTTYLMYVVNSFPNLIKYKLYRAGYDWEDVFPAMKRKVGAMHIRRLSPSVRNVIAHAGYMLVQGEVWARAYNHNKRARGFLNNMAHLYSPDGKRRFRIGSAEDVVFTGTSSKPVNVSPALSEAALVTSIRNVLQARESVMYGETEGIIRNTYHDRLTKFPIRTIMSTILNPELSVVKRSILSIDDVIRDPQLYLKPELLEMLKGNTEEGNTAFRLKKWLETNIEGVSIDIASNTGKYILVDDNAFDDLLKSEMINKSESTESTLYKRFANRDDVHLSDFYNKKVSTDLHIDSNIRVIISDKVNSETVFERGAESGIIYIHADELTSDSKLLDTLNHEFRHLMQYYNKFTTGFTTRFDVSAEMRKDFESRVPELFEDETVRRWAEAAAKAHKTNWKDEVIRNFVYYLTSGELMAYGFDASILSMKPIIVREEAGGVTIHMPWYNAKTNDGYYRTKRLAMMEEGYGPLKLPKLPKKEKTAESRGFSKAKAKDTNLARFEKSGQRNQLDPAMQKFVIATTGHEKEIHPVLWNAIRDGILNRERFNDWFKTVDLDEVNDFTFNLIRKHIFSNDHILTVDELKELTTIGPEYWWAMAKVLTEHGMPLEKLLLEGDLLALQEFFENESKNAKLRDDEKDSGSQWGLWINDALKEFYSVKVGDTEKTLEPDAKVAEGVRRILLMSMYDSTPTAAFEIGRRYRKAVERIDAEDPRTGKYARSLDEEHKNDSSTRDDKAQTLAETLDEEELMEGGVSSIITDITTLWEVQGAQRDIATPRLAHAYYLYRVVQEINSLELSDNAKARIIKELQSPVLLKKKISTLSKKDNLTEDETRRLKNLRFMDNRYKEIDKSVTKFKAELDNLPFNEIMARYSRLVMAESIGAQVNEIIFDLSKKLSRELSQDTKFEIETNKEGEERMSKVIKDRSHTQGRIISTANTILGMIGNPNVPITFNDLSPEIQEMFELKDFVDEKSKRKTSVYQLRNEVYNVGKGKVALEGGDASTTKSRYFHVRKKDLTKGNEEYRHDISEILKVDDQLWKERKRLTQLKNDRLTRTRKLEKENEKLRKSMSNTSKTIKELKERNNVRVVEFTVKEKQTKTRKPKVSDTPNQFNVISAIDMPDKLKQIFDVSFNELADTRVQFASENEQGELYDKKKHGNKFESIVKHEVANWDAFYDAVRSQLLELTRDDIFSLVDFFEHGMLTIDGPANKLKAFEVFILGYIYDAANQNFNGWNFSELEVKRFKDLFERRASEYGSGLNAVQQMQKVIDPLKRVRSRMFDDFFTVSDGEKNDLIEHLVGLQHERDPEKRKERSKEIADRLKDIQEKEFEARSPELKKFSKAWFKRLFTWNKVKSFRYLSMLSSPMTGIRNQVSNINLSVLNASSDFIAKTVLTKKGYHKGQLDLSKVKVSEEVKQFYDNEIKNNPVFKSMYNMSGKYDERQSKSKINEQGTFATLLARAIEQKYAAEHRFDSVAMNNVTKAINWMLSDSYFVKRAASKYFTKMLTLEVEAGKVKLDGGLRDTKILNIFAEAVIAANQDFMHKRSFMADMLDSLYDRHRVAYETLNFWLPFVNSSLVWTTELLKYTPFGLINAVHRMCTLEKQITKLDARRADKELVPDSRLTEYLIRRDIGKGSVGILLLFLGIMARAFGLFKLDEEDDKFYVIAGDVKVDFTDVFGTSSLFIGMSIAQTWMEDEEKTRIDRFNDMSRRISEYALEGLFINDILDRHKWNTSMYDKMITESESFLRSFTPQIVRLAISLTNNEEIRYSKGFKGAWERWLNDWVPTQPAGSRKVNPYTGEIETEFAMPIIGDFLKKGIAFGSKIFWYDISDEEQLCREYEVNKNELTGELTVDNKKYQLDRMTLNLKYGELNKASLAIIKSQKHYVKMPDGTYETLPWDKLDYDQRQNVLSRTMTKNADYAKIYVWTQNGHKVYVSESMWNTLRKLGITKNVYKGDKGFVE